jgi:hypothetical protein
MVAVYESAKREAGYNATRFLQMVSTQGGVGAARQLLAAGGVSDGFAALWQAGRPDLTVEAQVLRPEFADLFTAEERRIAADRLDQYRAAPSAPTAVGSGVSRRSSWTDRLAAYLTGANTDALVLSFDEIDEIVGGALPPSARRHQPVWSNSAKNPYSRGWVGAGYIASFRDREPGTIAFWRRNDETARIAEPTAAGPVEDAAGVPAVAAAVLVGCVATKLERPAPARDLYSSPLFRFRRAHAERSGLPWLILSAEHGLVEPDRVIEPYDTALASLPAARRAGWGEGIAAGLERRFGDLGGLTFEVHAGSDYVEAIRGPLRRRGAELSVPLRGMAIGEQLQWYSTAESGRGDEVDGATEDRSGLAAELVRQITEGFQFGTFRLQTGHQLTGSLWSAMPEVIAADRLRAAGVGNRDVRLFITFVAALDRARDADRLWRLATDLWLRDRWIFEPTDIVGRSLGQLSGRLRASGVSQRHLVDAAGWRLIAESLAEPDTSPVHRVILDGAGDTRDLLDALAVADADGVPQFPMLAGPKVGPMWVRMMVVPGQARVSRLDLLPVAVDVQVRKVTEYLGLTATAGRDLDKVRPVIQQAWQAALAVQPAAGPPELEGTAAALDPALWFFAKWGCSTCEQAGKRQPISPVCDHCLFA